MMTAVGKMVGTLIGAIVGWLLMAWIASGRFPIRQWVDLKGYAIGGVVSAIVVGIGYVVARYFLHLGHKAADTVAFLLFMLMFLLFLRFGGFVIKQVDVVACSKCCSNTS